MVSKKTITIAENGHLGEAFCSALLAQRFWVLRRSVDLDGADFIIQLTDAAVRFTDPLPPRLGVVQSKFSQDRGTTHYIPVEHIVDQKTGKPHTGFFLMIHMGREADKKRYLLSAQQIVNHLKGDERSYRVGATAYSSCFEVNDDTAALDIIEQVLKNRSEADSRHFLHSVQIPEYPLKRSNLEPPWLTPIPNEVLFIPDEVYMAKSSLKTVIDCWAAPLEAIGAMLMEQDAHKCLELFENLKKDPDVSQRDGAYWFNKQGPLRINNEGLAKAIAVHRRRDDLLSADVQKAQCYAELFEKLWQLCWQKFERLEPKMESIKGGFRFVPYQCILSFKVNAKSFLASDIALKIDADSDLKVNKNKIVVSRQIFTSAEGSRLEAVRDMHQVIHLAMVEYFKFIFPSEDVGVVRLPMLLME